MLPHAAVVAALLALAPYSRARPQPGWAETQDQYEARLAGVAADVEAVAANSTEVAYLLGIAWHESGFALDVQVGPCVGTHAGRCDGGRARGPWQLHGASSEATLREQAALALRRVRASVHQCAGNPPGERLAAYASGRCDRGLGAARELESSVVRARSELARAVEAERRRE